MTTRRLLSIPEQATLSAALVAQMQTQLPEWTAQASDPGVYWADLMAAEMIRRATEFNASADASWLFTATAGALEDLVAQYGLARLPDETDAELRIRAVAQFSSRAVGTEQSALTDAFAASPMVADASIQVDRAANEIDVWITAVPADDTPDDIAPSTALRTAVQAYLNESVRKLIWIDYAVLAPTVTTYQVAGAVVYARGADNPEVAATARLTAWMLERRTLDTLVSVSALTAAIFGPDIVDVDLTSPAADLPKSKSVAYVGSVGTLIFTEESA